MIKIIFLILIYLTLCSTYASNVYVQDTAATHSTPLKHLSSWLFYHPKKHADLLSAQTHDRYIALTIDDLPFVGEAKSLHLNLIIDTLKNNKIPATGFVITREITKANWPALMRFKEAGLSIGNHSHSHKNINNIETEAYLRDQFDIADTILEPIITSPKFYRFPYMNMSTGLKKERIINYLISKEYHIAPITIDSKDFLFNQLLLDVPEKDRRNFLTIMKASYINFIWEQTLKAESLHTNNRAQILLIHANLLNAYVLQDIIDLYHSKGYKFITLQQALGIV